MSIQVNWFETCGVAPDGSVEGGASVRVDGAVFESSPEGGCGSPGCSCSPGHWITKLFPRTSEGVVAGYTAHFQNRADLENIGRAELEELAAKARH